MEVPEPVLEKRFKRRHEERLPETARAGHEYLAAAAAKLKHECGLVDVQALLISQRPEVGLPERQRVSCFERG